MNASAPPVVIGRDKLVEFCRDIMTAAGIAGDEARRIVERLVGANLTGHDSHGIGRVPRYVQMLEQGLVLAGRSVTVVRQSEAHLLLDGNGGFGQVIGEEAVIRGCDHAAVHGASVVGLSNTGHLGRIGDWAELAAERGYISIHMVSVRGRSLVAPFGGIDRRLSTAPFCVGVPQSGAPPLILDFATSMVSEGKALVAASGGPPLPSGALVSAAGLPSNDPVDLYGATLADRVPNASMGGGALAAFGAHKGAGLSFMIEILAGALTGTGVNRTLNDETEKPFRNSMLSIYLDPDRFAGREFVESQARDFAAYLHSSRAAAGHEGVLVPGEIENRKRADRLAIGIPLPRITWEALAALGKEKGVAVPELVENR